MFFFGHGYVTLHDCSFKIGKDIGQSSRLAATGFGFLVNLMYIHW